MALSLKDIRLTVRRTRGADALVIYPKLLRDRSVLPKVDICVQYLESMVGRERQDLDTEVLVHFLGDHRLARALVSCLGAQYRFTSPPLMQVVDAPAVARLQGLGISTPADLRLWVFDQLNEGGFGYLSATDRARALSQFEAQLCLQPDQLEQLMVLDAEEHAILRRVSPQPAAVDVVAHYNFAVLEGLLRHVTQVQLGFRGAAFQQQFVRELCAAADVDAAVQTRGADLSVHLEGRQDAMGVWSRHGRRLSRLLLELLQRSGGSAVEGSASIALRGRTGELRLTDEAYGYLEGPGARAGEWDLSPSWTPEIVEETAAALRSAGWRASRQPEALVCAAGVLLPDLALQRSERSAMLVQVRSAEHASALAATLKGLRVGQQLLLVGAAASLAPFAGTPGVRLIQISRTDGKSIAAAIVRDGDAGGLGIGRRKAAHIRAA